MGLVDYWARFLGLFGTSAVAGPGAYRAFHRLGCTDELLKGWVSLDLRRHAALSVTLGGLTMSSGMGYWGPRASAGCGGCGPRRLLMLCLNGLRCMALGCMIPRMPFAYLPSSCLMCSSNVALGNTRLT